MNQSQKPLPPDSTILGYLQLVRLPNVFMAITDVLMGYLFSHAVLQPGDGSLLGLLVVTSVLLYMAGMVLNDVFDADIDAQERPDRPIPSGRVSRPTARLVGWQFLGLGVITGWLVAIRVGDLRPGIIVSLLAGCVVLYDGFLKRLPIGPLGMGACRMLNVLLGMSLGAPALGRRALAGRRGRGALHRRRDLVLTRRGRPEPSWVPHPWNAGAPAGRRDPRLSSFRDGRPHADPPGTARPMAAAHRDSGSGD